MVHDSKAAQSSATCHSSGPGPMQDLNPLFPTHDVFVGRCRYPLRLLGFWLVHSLWQWGVLLPTTATLSFHVPLSEMTALQWAAAAAFVAALLFEAVADHQKAVARRRGGGTGRCEVPMSCGELLLFVSFCHGIMTPMSIRSSIAWCRAGCVCVRQGQHSASVSWPFGMGKRAGTVQKSRVKMRRCCAQSCRQPCIQCVSHSPATDVSVACCSGSCTQACGGCASSPTMPGRWACGPPCGCLPALHITGTSCGGPPSAPSAQSGSSPTCQVLPAQ